MKDKEFGIKQIPKFNKHIELLFMISSSLENWGEAKQKDITVSPMKILNKMNNNKTTKTMLN